MKDALTPVFYTCDRIILTLPISIKWSVLQQRPQGVWACGIVLSSPPEGTGSFL
jgi:hypothetical protein